MSTANQSSLVLAAATQPEDRRALSFGYKQALSLLQVAAGYALIMATIWTEKALQRRLFWITAAYFLSWGAAAAWERSRRGFKLPPARVTALVIVAALLVAGALMALAATFGTLHVLFGKKDPLLHAGSYLLWAILQQIMQQVFFLARFEQLTHRGVLASFATASLFGVAHLPNPVLAPVTFAGGWLMSELYLRYRTVLPLGIAHGLVGMALAVSIPDHIQHHMRVGLGYLSYTR